MGKVRLAAHSYTSEDSEGRLTSVHVTVGWVVVGTVGVVGTAAHLLVAVSNSSPVGQLRGICSVEEKHSR